MTDHLDSIEILRFTGSAALLVVCCLALVALIALGVVEINNLIEWVKR